MENSEAVKTADREKGLLIRWPKPGKRRNRKLKVLAGTFPISGAGSNGRCNTIWYKAVFKGGVYETRKTVWPFRGAEVRRVASLEGGADAA